MPAVVVAVVEDHVVREVVIVVYQVGEVGHCFAALIAGRVEFGKGVICYVAVDFPTVAMLEMCFEKMRANARRTLWVLWPAM